jgi:polyisoprenoid-binding protein YceI
MSRRLRRWIVAVAGLVVVVIGGGFALFAVRGSDAPPPPALARTTAADTDRSAASGTSGSTTFSVSRGGETFVGYRVRERFIGLGVADAVGRTGEVSGAVRVDGARLAAARLEANLRALRSDEARRDRAMRDRGLETDRFPTARFRLTGPVVLSRRGTGAGGRLTLHGRTRPIRVAVRGQRLASGTLEVVGSAPIRFERFGIDPPSVAGFVSVQDQGTLEFRLRLRSR